VVIHVAATGLDNEDVCIPHGLGDLDVDLPVRELGHRTWGERDVQPGHEQGFQLSLCSELCAEPPAPHRSDTA
jgi:hypothetical protein